MNFKTLNKRIQTNKEGVFYKQVVDNKDKEVDKVYLIRWRENDKDRLKTIGKYSEGIRVNYCVQKRNEIITKLRLGEEPPTIAKKKKKDITTLDDLADIYFKDKELHSKTATRRLGKYKLHIGSRIGNKDINLIKDQDIDNIQKELLKEKKANATINNVVALTSTIINHAIKKGIYTGSNPITKVQSLKEDNHRERFLNIDECKQLIEAVSDDIELSLFVKLSLSTGGRLETILHIQKKDIDFTHNSINLKDLKNDNTYKGFIDDELKEILKHYSNCINSNDNIVPSSSSTISRKLSTVLNKLFNQGLETTDRKNRVVIHTLRHTFASLLAINETPILTIKKLMNHRDIKQTMRYAKLSPDNGSDRVVSLMSKLR
jgi:integrase